MTGSDKISAEEVLQRIQNKKEVNLIDVRTDEEVASGIIPGARHIPLHELPERMQELDKEKEYILVCRSDGRSGKATKFLNANGYKALNMIGGMLKWQGKLE